MSDYIDRQAAIKAIDDLPNCYNGYSDTYDKAYIIEVLEDLPHAEVEPVKRGKWIEHYLEKWRDAPWGYNCSECGAWFVVGQEPIKRYHYCPNCGARMEAEEADHASL